MSDITRKWCIHNQGSHTVDGSYVLVKEYKLEELIKRVESLQSENAALRDRVKTLTIPTMYWVEDGSESLSLDDEYDIADRLMCDCDDTEWHEFSLMCARALPDRVLMVRVINGDRYEWHWKAEAQEQKG